MSIVTTVMLVLAAAAPGESPLPEAHRTDLVVVRTDLGSAWAHAAAAAIEAQRAALLAELGPLVGIRENPRPLTLLAFRSSADYRAYAAREAPVHVRSLGWYDPARALAVVHTDTPFLPLHEASHWVLREVLGLPARGDLPVWVAEGIPCLAEAPDEKGFSAYRRYRLAVRVKAGLDPIVGLVATEGDLGGGRDDDLYAAGWVVAHFLRERRPEVLRAYLSAIRPTGPLPDLAALAELEPETLERALREHVAALPAVAREAASARFPALVPDDSRPASEAEVGRQVEFLRHPDEAVSHVAMAWFSNHDHPAIAPALLAALPTEGPRFRMDACRQLAHHAPTEAIVPLVDLLGAEEPEIRLRAIRCLYHLTHQRLEYRPHDDEDQRAAAIARWRAWLAEKGLTK